jgi:betaine-homocysteine S-methyltransferase
MSEALGRDTAASRYSPAIELHPVLGAARDDGTQPVMGGWSAAE